MKCRLFLVTTAVAATVFSASRVSAQAIPAAHSNGELQAGLAFSNGNSDYAPKRIGGASAYATFDFTKHLGVEADIHLLSFLTPNDLGERSYEAGIRYVYRVRRYEPYAKGLVGIAQDVNQSPFSNAPTGSFNVLSLGGGLDIRIPKKLTVRVVDFEYQKWPGFYPNPLSPSMLSFGLAYRIR